MNLIKGGDRMPRGGARPNAGRKKKVDIAGPVKPKLMDRQPRFPGRSSKSAPTRRRVIVDGPLPLFTVDEKPAMADARKQMASYSRDIHVPLVREMARAGLGDGVMADACGVSLTVFDRWNVKHPEFAQACRIGKEDADARVERVLYQMVIGYDYDATKIVVHQGHPMAVRYREHMPPNPDLIKYWLGNRKREIWQRDPEKYAPAIEVNNITNVDNRVQAMVTFDPKELEGLDEASLARMLSDHLNTSEAAVVDEEAT